MEKIDTLEETSSMVVEFSKSTRKDLKMIQAKLVLIGVEKTMQEIATECLTLGVIQKFKSLEP